MQILMIVAIVACGSIPSHAQVDYEAFHHSVCRKCDVGRCGQHSVLEGIRRGKAGPPGPVGPRGPPSFANMSAIKEVIDDKIVEHSSQVEELIDKKIEHAIKEFSRILSRGSCANVPIESAISRNETGGVFDIYIPSNLGLTKVYCDMRTDGGEWIVFQRRMDGRIDFYRNWIDYVSGFGDLTQEFWLGLEAIHQLTKNGAVEMRVDMIERTTGAYYYAKYSSFKLGPSSDNYRLSLSGYSGNASDAIANPSGTNGGSGNDLHNKQFSTKDADHDISPGTNCALNNGKGGWWYGGCTWSNLNGLYDARNYSGVVWRNQNTGRSMSMRFTEMKLKPKT